MLVFLCAALSSVLSATAPSAQTPHQASFEAVPTARLADAVFDRLGAVRYDLQDLRLPAPEGAPPAELVVRVVHDGEPQELLLSRHSVRADDAALRVHSGVHYAPQALPAPRTYRGTVAGQPGSQVLASLRMDGLSARVTAPGSVDWSIVPLTELALETPRRATTHVVFDEEFGRSVPAPCGSVGDAVHSSTPVFGTTPGGALPFDWQQHCQRRFEIAFDADFEYFQSMGSSVDAVVARIDEMLNEVDFFYARDVRATFELTEYVVRTAPFYTPVSGGDLLDQFRAEWNTALVGVPRDLAHLMTGKPGSLVEFGGLAWVGATCNVGLAYGWSMDGANIIGHEVGHNFGANHCHDTAPCNNMCGACHYIAPITKGIIQGYIAQQSCYERVDPYGTPLPPYSVPEGLSMRKDELEALTALQADVLANDHDGNCTPVHIASVDATSPQGGSVSIAHAAGPKGRDLLAYSPPIDVFVGTDDVGYAIAGSHPPALDATFPIEVRPLSLAAYWNLDESVGTTANDLGAGAAHGTLVGGPTWTSAPAGAAGSALLFDGVDDKVVMPALPLALDELSMSAWVRRDGPQTPLAGIAFHRGEGSPAGLKAGFGSQLGYQWGDEPATWGWNSGLTLPDGEWVFVALSVEPEAATLYLYDGALQTAVNTLPHPPLVWSGSFEIGADPATSVQHFAGAIDDVRVYDHALDSAQVLALATSGGAAVIPSPVDGGVLPDPGGALRWVAALGADAHDVYFGTSYAAVRDATTASPQYQGEVLDTAFTPPPLAPDTTYYWRVDELDGATRVPGQVWQFRLAQLDHWRLDETSGLVATNATGGNAGLYLGGTQLGEPAALPGLGTSVRLDGSNDHVNIPALNLDADTLTITTWFRTDGAQTPWSGLVFSRGGTTTAGLNFGEAGELRYHWDAGQWPWNSGLVPANDTWTFAALVVEPERATIYMSSGGELLSASNESGHGAEAFDAPLMIGQDAAGGRFFDGWIDDVRIYTEALTKSQLEQLFGAR